MQFRVDSEQVAAASARTRASVDAISQEVNAMMGHLTALQNSWTGPAAAAFAGLAQQWRSTQAQVEASLNQISLQLNTASHTYQDAETTATSLFAGV